MVRNITHSKINDNHIIIIQYLQLFSALISSFIALIPLILAKFVTNACIFSPLNTSLITMNSIINEIIAITNINILNTKWLEIEVSMKISSSLSKVSYCLLKLNFVYTFQLNPSMFLEQIIICLQRYW